MFHLAKYFAVEVEAFSIMSNHFHLVIYFDPMACRRWSDDEVALRWVEAFPPIENGEVVEELKPIFRQRILENKAVVNIPRPSRGL